MRDKVKIQVNGKEVEQFEKYSIASDIFTAGDDFSFTLARGLIEVNEGDLIKAFVNDSLELTGVINSVTEDDSKQNGTLEISGKDVLGLAVEGYVEEFKSQNGRTLEEIAKALIKPVEVLNRSSIKFEKGSSSFNIKKEFSKAEIGDTIFDRLSRIATSKRLLFFAEPDGTLIFGKLPTEKENDFRLFRAKEGEDKNILTATRTRNFEGVYSEVRLYGQTNGGSNIKAIAKNPDAPFRKIFVGTFNEDEGSIEEQARAVVENQRKDSLVLEYSTPGHSQNSKNWSIRKGVSVEDERFDISDIFLITSRVFEGGKTGQSTKLKFIRYAQR